MLSRAKFWLPCPWRGRRGRNGGTKRGHPAFHRREMGTASFPNLWELRENTGWVRSIHRTQPPRGGSVPCKACDLEQSWVSPFWPRLMERRVPCGACNLEQSWVSPFGPLGLSPLAPVLRGEGPGARGESLAQLPLTPNPSPRSTGERGTAGGRRGTPSLSPPGNGNSQLPVSL